jgi:glycosyltransferase involved in cell wall biosynthesis
MSLPGHSVLSPMTVRLGPEAFTKHIGGVRRVALDLMAALSDEGVAVDVNHRIRRGVGMTTPEVGILSRLAVNAAELAFPFSPGRRPTVGVRHVLYYEPFLLNARWPVVATVYDMIHELHGAGSSRLTQVKKMAIRRADAVVAISAATASDAAQIFATERPIHVIPLGISEAFLEFEHDQLRSPRERPYVLFVGSRAGYKNFETLRVAFGSRRELAEYSLLLVGGEVPSASDRQDWERTFGADRVEHLGHVSDAELAQLYSSAGALALPAKYEGFGLPVLEAMAVRCPVACSTGGSLPEVASGHAHLFSPSSVEECGEAIVQALAMTDVARTEAARYAQTFTWQRTAQTHIRLYQSLLESS